MFWKVLKTCINFLLFPNAEAEKWLRLCYLTLGFKTLLKLFITLPVNVCTLLYTQAVISNTFCAVYCFCSSQHSPLLLSITSLFSVQTVHTPVCTFHLSLSLNPFGKFLDYISLAFIFSLNFFSCIVSFWFFILFSPSSHSSSFNYVYHYLPLSSPLCQPCFSFSTRCLCPDGEALGQAERQTWLGYEL